MGDKEKILQEIHAKIDLHLDKFVDNVNSLDYLNRNNNVLLPNYLNWKAHSLRYSIKADLEEVITNHYTGTPFFCNDIKKEPEDTGKSNHETKLECLVKLQTLCTSITEKIASSLDRV